MAERDRSITQSEMSQVPGSCAHFNLRRADRVMTRLYDEMLRPSGLKSTQFTLLAAVRLMGPVTVNALAAGIVMDRTTLTRNLRPLKKERWIAVEPGKDRRVREVTLTAEGRRVLEKAYPLWREAQASVSERLGGERLEHLLDAVASSTRRPSKKPSRKWSPRRASSPRRTRPCSRPWA